MKRSFDIWLHVIAILDIVQLGMQSIPCCPSKSSWRRAPKELDTISQFWDAALRRSKLASASWYVVYMVALRSSKVQNFRMWQCGQCWRLKNVCGGPGTFCVVVLLAVRILRHTVAAMHSPGVLVTCGSFAATSGARYNVATPA